jgi:hypothetical protein
VPPRPSYAHAHADRAGTDSRGTEAVALMQAVLHEIDRRSKTIDVRLARLGWPTSRPAVPTRADDASMRETRAIAREVCDLKHTVKLIQADLHERRRARRTNPSTNRWID